MSTVRSANRLQRAVMEAMCFWTRAPDSPEPTFYRYWTDAKRIPWWVGAPVSRRGLSNPAAVEARPGLPGA